MKSNYAKPDTLPLHWTNGVLRPTDQKFMSPADKLDAEMRAGQAQQQFLNALDLLASRGISLSDAARASNYAPREIERHGMLGDFAKREMEQAMLGLLGRGLLAANEPVGRGDNRHVRRGLARRFTKPEED